MLHILFSSQTEADRFFLEIAMSERAASDDPKAKVSAPSGVGAVITSNNREISRSANVLPPKISDERSATGQLVEAEERYHIIEHAERAAIYKALNAGNDLNGATIYCTRFPCSDCARAIVWAGISRTVFPSGFAGEERWLTSQRAALDMLRQAGVTVRYLRP